MKEIEVKILEINKEHILSKLEILGAKLAVEGEFYAVFYDTSEGDLRQRQATLRLRNEAGKTVLALKKKISNTAVKIMDETEIEVSDFAALQKILHFLGFEIQTFTRKWRAEYHLGKAKVVLDQYHDLDVEIPLFLEIEADSIESCYKVAEQLGYTPKDCVSWNTFELIRHYSRR